VDDLLDLLGDYGSEVGELGGFMVVFTAAMGGET